MVLSCVLYCDAWSHSYRSLHSELQTISIFINRSLGFSPRHMLVCCLFFSFYRGQAVLLNYADTDSSRNNHWRVLRKWKLDGSVVFLWLIKRPMLWKQGSEWSCFCSSSILFPRLSLWTSGSSHTGLCGALNMLPMLCLRTWHLHHVCGKCSSPLICEPAPLTPFRFKYEPFIEDIIGCASVNFSPSLQPFDSSYLASLFCFSGFFFPLITYQYLTRYTCCLFLLLICLSLSLD